MYDCFYCHLTIRNLTNKQMKYIAITTTNSGYQRFNESYSGETLEDFKKRLQVNPEWKYGRFFEAKEIF